MRGTCRLKLSWLRERRIEVVAIDDGSPITLSGKLKPRD